MGLLDAFNETWSQARETFGQGTPEDGSKFDGSSRLLQMKSSVEAAAPDSRWQGTASDAYAAANKEHAQVYGKLADLDKRMAAEVTNAANVVTTGRQNLDNVKSWVTSMAATIPDTDADERDRKLLPIVNKGVSQLSDIIQKSTNDMTDIRGRVQGIKGEYDALTNQKFAPGEKGPGDKKDDKRRLGIDGDKGDNKDGSDKKDANKPDPIEEKARRDVDAALNGDKDAQQRVRNVLNTVSEDQQTGKGKLNPEQAAYLSQMQAQQKLRSVEQLDEAAKKGAKDIMANSWQLMSNPQIEFPKTESRDGAVQSNEVVKGGFDKLPDSVKSAIQSPGIQQSGNLQKIADIVNAGDGKHFQHNTDLDRGLMHKVADMMESKEWRSGDPAFRLPDWANGPIDYPWEHERPPHSALEKVASDIMNGIHNDHQVIHDAVTGKVEPGNEFRDQFKIDKDHFMYNITHEAWDDHGIGAGSMFEWMHDSAVGPEAQIAGETAHSVSDFIGKHPDLMSLNSQTTVGLSGTHSLGEVNPNLVRGMAEGLSPFVNNIAGTAGGLPAFGHMLDGAGDMQNGTLPEAKNVFSVLNSDSGAAKIFNGAAYGQALLHDTAYAQHPDTGERPAGLYDSATLRALVDVGMQNSIDTEGKNQAQIDADLYKLKSSAFDYGVQGLTEMTGQALPGVGGELSSQAAGILGPALKDSIIGPEPPQPGAPDPIPRFAPERAEAEMLNTLNSVGTHITDLPPEYRGPNGVVLSYEQMAAKDPTFAISTYQATINSAINHTLGFDFQDGLIKSRYDQITANQTPKG